MGRKRLSCPWFARRNSAGRCRLAGSTEERRLESSLLQAGKLAAIGQLAAGVAHEINNPLTAINANAEMLKMALSPDDENYESADLIVQAGERAAKVVRGFARFRAPGGISV